MKPASPPLSPQPAICQPAGSPGYLLTRQPIRARAPLVIPSCLCSPRVFLAFSLGFPRAHVPVALMFPSCRLPAVCQPYSTPFGRQRVGQCGGNLISPRGQPESQPVSLIASLLDMQVASQPICQLANLPVSQFGRSKNETTTLFHIGGKGLAYTVSSHQPVRNPVCQAANLPVSQRLSAVQSDWSANRQKMKRQPDITPAVNARLITVTKPITPPARMGARGLQKARPSD